MASAFSNPRFLIERRSDKVNVDLSALKVLDESTAQEIRQPLLSLAKEIGAGHLSINLKGIEYITSSMLETLIQMNRHFKALGGKLTLHHLQPQVAEVFEVTKLTELFEIHPAEE
jgi:anti-sigma B factor antagonist